MNYRDEITRAMTWLGEQPDTLFLGQAVAAPGTGMTPTLVGVPREKLIELPVAEDMQLGMCTGLALAGHCPISIYPRWNFLLLATNQLVLHLDKLPLYGNGYRPRVIIRVAVATPEPLDPGPQHLGDFTETFAHMLETIRIVKLDHAEQIMEAYGVAYHVPRSTIIVERTDLYGA